jgi:hypothetical protein
MNYQNPQHERLDEATQQRLARLANTPVDTTRLEARLNKAINPQQPTHRVSRAGPIRWWRPVSRIAAVVAVAGLIGMLLIPLGNSPAIASTTDLARVHREVVAGEPDLVPATNFAQANDAIQSIWAQAPKLPEPTVGQVTASCLHSVANRDVACLKLEFNNQPITMVVGHSREVVCSAAHQQITRNGRNYMSHDQDDVRMVMIARQGRWVCLMGSLSLDELIEVADGLRF